MRDRVALEAVRTALKQDEFGLRVLEVTFHAAPGHVKFRISRARRHWNIELCTFGLTRAGFFSAARTRVEISTIFVKVGKNQIGIVFETVKHTVAVVCIDIDIGNAPDSVFLAKIFHRNTEVIEHAESCRMIATCMVQTSDWHESPLGCSVHDSVDSCEHGANDVGGRIEYSQHGRSITVIEITAPLRRFLRHHVNVVRGVKQQQIFDAGTPWLAVLNGTIESGALELILKDVVPVEAERVRIAKAIAGELAPFIDKN